MTYKIEDLIPEPKQDRLRCIRYYFNDDEWDKALDCILSQNTIEEAMHELYLYTESHSCCDYAFAPVEEIF